MISSNHALTADRKNTRPLKSDVRPHKNRMPCAYCKTVNTICFWGPMPEKPWKRPVLLILSVVGTFGFGALLWLAWGKATSVLFIGLAIALVALFVLGVLVSINACNACVARLFGSA